MNPQIEIIVDDIAKNLANTVFFVGAGISRRSGLPLFWEINRKILLQTTQIAPEKLVSLRPEILLQLIQNELGNNVLSFLKIFRDKQCKPNSNHYLLAHIIKHRGYVITTNWDDLIEQACNNINAPFKVIYTSKDFEDFVNDKIESNTNCGYIFKMHGNIEEKDGNLSYESIQMTIGDIQCGLDKNKSKFLDIVKAKKNFCFMGYSGMDDFDIIPEMRKKSTNGSFYWLQHNEETTQVMKKDDLLHEDKHNRPDDSQYYQIKNVNDVLHTCANPYKILIDTDDFVSHLCDKLSISMSYDNQNDSSHSHLGNYPVAVSDNTKNFILGELYEIAHDGHNAISYFENIMNRNDGDQARAYYLLGGIYNRFFGKEKDKIMHLYDTSFDLYEKMLMHCEENSRESILEKQSVVLLSKANYLRRETDCVDEAQTCMEKARSCYPKINDDAGFNNVYGLLYYKKKELDKSEMCLEKALRQRGCNLSGIAETNNAFGITLMANRKPDDALSYFQVALDANKRLGQDRKVAQQYTNLIRCYAKCLEHYGESSEKNYLQKGLQAYWNGIKYWFRNVPHPPQEILECKLRLCEIFYEYALLQEQNSDLCKQYCDYGMRILSIIKERYLEIDKPKKSQQSQRLLDKFVLLCRS